MAQLVAWRNRRGVNLDITALPGTENLTSKVSSVSQQPCPSPQIRCSGVQKMCPNRKHSIWPTRGCHSVAQF